MINELNSRSNRKTKNISEVKIGDDVITSPTEMAEAFNSYFSNVGVNLAAEIPSPKFTPGSHLTPANKTFSIQTSTIGTVCRLLKSIDEKKSVGLDNIPNKLLKIAVDVVAPSLINRNIYPVHKYRSISIHWKEASVSLLHKKGVKNDPLTYISYPGCLKNFRKNHL